MKVNGSKTEITMCYYILRIINVMIYASKYIFLLFLHIYHIKGVGVLIVSKLQSHQHADNPFCLALKLLGLTQTNTFFPFILQFFIASSAYVERNLNMALEEIN
jgi:hypothetical protein